MEALANDKNISKKEIINAALEVFFNIVKLWKVKTSDAKILLGLDKDSSVYFTWQRNKSGILSNDQLDRISYIVGIFKALRILFSDKQQGYDWIKKPNRAFNEKSPLEIMTQGKITDLAIVRGYLDANRGW